MTAPLQRELRLVVALIIGTAGAAILGAVILSAGPEHRTDFGPVWFGANALWDGVNPYLMVGPDRLFKYPWGLNYPATAMLLVMPLAWLPENAAAIAFVFISSALLAYLLTRDGWHRLPLFLSPAFVVAVSAAQWSPLLTCGLLTPSFAWAFAGKPNHLLSLAAASRDSRGLVVALATITAFSIGGFLMLPSWPADWWRTVAGNSSFKPPITQVGGVLVLLALFRWRRWEARLIVGLALTPQTGYWYETLPLLLVASTYRESASLSLISGLGFILERQLLGHNVPVTGRE